MKIIISPHLDDETIALGGTIAKWTKKENERVLVICIIDDDYKKNTKFEEISDPVKIRRDEIEEVSKILGFEYFVLFENSNIDGNLRNKNYKEIVWKIENLIVENKFDHYKIDIYFPSLSSHQDHNALNEIGNIMMRRTRKTCWNFYEYYMPWDFFKVIECGEIYNDITDFIEDKRNALCSYKSQMRKSSALSIKFIIDVSKVIGRMLGNDRSYEIIKLKRKIRP